jgi:hypothetical protein
MAVTDKILVTRFEDGGGRALRNVDILPQYYATPPYLEIRYSMMCTLFSW